MTQNAEDFVFESSKPAGQGNNAKAHYNQQFYFETPATPVAPKPKKDRSALKISTRAAVVGAVVGSLVGGSVGAGVGVTVAALNSAPRNVIVNNTQDLGWVTAVAAKAAPSTVTISVSSSSSGGNGSGVILTEDGYVLTNTHVVTLEGQTAAVKIEVKTSDGKVFQAKVVGTDPTNDLAVVKILSTAKFTPIEFADSAKVNVGDQVVAIGAPLGLDQTVTAGIVSSLNRTIQVANSGTDSNGLQLYQGSGSAINLSVIQTDAAINPGNSGGALLDQNGKLVGINVAIATAGSGSTAGSIGVGFSIPSNIAKRIADEIIESGNASHAMLGAMVSDATNSDASAAFSVGAKIEQIQASSPAEKSGLKKGDVVTKLDGKNINSASDLTAAVRQLPAGTKVTLDVVRGDTTLKIEVTLGDAKDLKN